MGPGCGGANRRFEKVRALKREASAGQAWCFWGSSLVPSKILFGGKDMIQYFQIDYRIDKDGIPRKAPSGDYLMDTPLSDVDELILSEAKIISLP